MGSDDGWWRLIASLIRYVWDWRLEQLGSDDGWWRLIASLIRYVWDWRLEQWGLSSRDLPSMARGTHRLLHTTDTALYELTSAGARSLSRRLRAQPHVFYVALPCQITRRWRGARGAVSGAQRWDERRVVPSARASPWMVVTAALIDLASDLALGDRGMRSLDETDETDETEHEERDESYHHSDGLVPTASQRHLPTQPYRYVPQLTAMPARVLATALEPGVWCYGEPCEIEHGLAMLGGSPALECAIEAILPAICLRARQASNRL
jgi:hypothetical protein